MTFAWSVTLRLGEARRNSRQEGTISRVEKLEEFLKTGKRTVPDMMAYMKMNQDQVWGVLREICYESEDLTERMAHQKGRLGKRYWVIE